MKTLGIPTICILSIFVLCVATSVFAIDIDAMKKKGEAVKEQAGTVTKEGSQVKTDVKDMKAKEAMKDTGQTKDEANKLKDIVTGK